MPRTLAVVAVAVLAALSGCVGGLDASVADDPAPTVDGTAPAPSPGTPADERTRATVVEVVDGDTVRVEFGNGSRDTVRLLGVDAPETAADNDPAEFEGVPETAAGERCLARWGAAATAFARERLLGAAVTLSFDPREPRRGYYDRLLAYVHVDGVEFNYALLRRGLARVYDSSFVRGDRYGAAEAAASDGRIGLWACRSPGDGATPTPAPTATTTPSESGLRVAAVHADAAGPDGENLTDEYVVFENAGDGALNLSGWIVADAAGHEYVVPDGTVLGPGERLTLRTGSGEDGEGERYWGNGRPIWNNDGDVVIVRDGDGDVVLRHEYD